MGGGESVVGIASEQGHDGSDGIHYGEGTESLDAFVTCRFRELACRRVDPC